ncbi:hypothetical protein BGZ94_001820 [Podila epigama]|nr:hypothetical protein BGZ94_001820 [Podila epigama]
MTDCLVPLEEFPDSPVIPSTPSEVISPNKSRGSSVEPNPLLSSSDWHVTATQIAVSVTSDTVQSIATDTFPTQEAHEDDTALNELPTTPVYRLELRQEDAGQSSFTFLVRPSAHVVLGRASSKSHESTAVLSDLNTLTCSFLSKVVSKVHATIYEDNGDLFIEDENSTHGTFVNGQRVSSQQMLKDGDALTLGRHVVRKKETFTPLKLTVHIQSISGLLDAEEEEEQVRRLQDLAIHDSYIVHLNDPDNEVVCNQSDDTGEDSQPERSQSPHAPAIELDAEQSTMTGEAGLVVEPTFRSDKNTGTQTLESPHKRKRGDDNLAGDAPENASKRRMSLFAATFAGIAVGSVGTVLVLANI